MGFKSSKALLHAMKSMRLHCIAAIPKSLPCAAGTSSNTTRTPNPRAGKQASAGNDKNETSRIARGRIDANKRSKLLSGVSVRHPAPELQTQSHKFGEEKVEPHFAQSRLMSQHNVQVVERMPSLLQTPSGKQSTSPTITPSKKCRAASFLRESVYCRQVVAPGDIRKRSSGGPKHNVSPTVKKPKNPQGKSGDSVCPTTKQAASSSFFYTSASPPFVQVWASSLD